jgi:ribose transport system ATP-binding protein
VSSPMIESTSIEMSDNIFEMQKISKSFPGVQALDNVDFRCTFGEVHALVGENGAGKSTLMKILAGAYQPDGGKIFVRGKEVIFNSPKEAQNLGISVIYQEFNLIPEMNVAENIFLGREPLAFKGLVIDNDLLYERSKELLESLGTFLDPRNKVKNLSVAQQQMVEIAKSLCLNSDIIIMDEPSAVVSGKELDALFSIVRSLRDNGKAIVYISHRIDEIFQIANRATVLKDGKLIGTVCPKDIDKASIVRMMVGRDLDQTFPLKEMGERKEILSLNNICRGKVLKDVSLKVYSGEILGAAGLVGSGRTELARVIFGADSFDSGEIYYEGKKSKMISPKRSISKGVGFVTEDRKKEGFVGCFSVRKNLTSLILDKMKRWWFTNDREEKKLSKSCIKKFNIMTPGVEQEIQYLSGGNQQKVVLAKWLNANPKLIIMDEPTRGIDVGAKAEVYNTMRLMAKQGKALVMISSELPEIIGMSDRIVVMHQGEIMGEVSSSEATEEGILMMATGQVKKIGKKSVREC